MVKRVLRSNPDPKFHLLSTSDEPWSVEQGTYFNLFRMCQGDPQKACFYTCIVEIIFGFIGFCAACSAIKFQDKFNGIIDEHSDYGHDMVNINAASVGAFFFL